MVSNLPEMHFSALENDDLDRVLAGDDVDLSYRFQHYPSGHLHPGSTGVVWIRERGLSEGIRPVALVCREEDLKRLCVRYAQLRSDLSPLSPWCHLLTPAFVESGELTGSVPDLSGAEAAWTGLVVAEAALLSERPVGAVRLQSCLATQSFAIGRSLSLWKGHTEPAASLQRFDEANAVCRGGAAPHQKLRRSLSPIWDCLVSLSAARNVFDRDGSPVVAALRQLRDARLNGLGDEAGTLALATELASIAPEAEQFLDLAKRPPEARLRLFDRLVEAFIDSDRRDDGLRRRALGLLTGYLATIAAGGAPSLSLVEATGARLPELVAWAYVAGSIGERVLWTSSFDGLGRLVARELMRPLRLDEPPACDFALDEALAVVDVKLKDPLVRLRVKQARVATVAIWPGVNIAVPLDGPRDIERTEVVVANIHRPEPSSRDPLAGVLDAIRTLVRQEVRLQFVERKAIESRESEEVQQEDRRKRRRSTPHQQLHLPKK
jgi:hypothetical protein